MTSEQMDRPFRFIEVHGQEDDAPDSRDPYVEAYIASVEAQRCGLLVKEITNGLPVNKQLSHLKRVRRRLNQDEDKTNSSDKQINEAVTKRRKTTAVPQAFLMTLDILMGPCLVVDQHLSSDPTSNGKTTESILADRFKVHAVFRERVPRRPAECRAEWEEFDAIWPTNFYPLKTLEHKVKQLELSKNEIDQMIVGVNAAIADANEESNQELTAPGAVVVQNTTSDILSRASSERILQKRSNLFNPLQTSILLAIQGVSRTERQVATGTGMDSNTFQKGQYLCTGCTLYTTREPTLFEAMALVHARISQVVFMKDDACKASYVKGLTEKCVHNLPGTNHKYRAFQCESVTSKEKEVETPVCE